MARVPGQNGWQNPVRAPACQLNSAALLHQPKAYTARGIPFLFGAYSRVQAWGVGGKCAENSPEKRIRNENLDTPEFVNGPVLCIIIFDIQNIDMQSQRVLL